MLLPCANKTYEEIAKINFTNLIFFLYSDKIYWLRAGIPYASPPLNSLRFMPPVTGALWSKTLKADR